MPASVFENWGLPVIQGLTTYFSADEYRRDIRGLDLVSLPVCVYQPEFDGQLISVPYAVTERTADASPCVASTSWWELTGDRRGQLGGRWG